MELYLNNFIPEYKDKAGLFLCMSGYADVLINNQIFHLEKGTLYMISPLVMIYKVSQSTDFDGIHMIDSLEVFYPVINSHMEFRRAKRRQTAAKIGVIIP